MATHRLPSRSASWLLQGSLWSTPRRHPAVSGLPHARTAPVCPSKKCPGAFLPGLGEGNMLVGLYREGGGEGICCLTACRLSDGSPVPALSSPHFEKCLAITPGFLRHHQVASCLYLLLSQVSALRDLPSQRPPIYLFFLPANWGLFYLLFLEGLYLFCFVFKPFTVLLAVSRNKINMSSICL